MSGQSVGLINLGSLVREYRIASRLTQARLAETAGIPIGTLRDLEQGRRSFPRWETVESILATLAVGPTKRKEILRSLETDAIGPATHDDASSLEAGWLHIKALGPLTASRGSVPISLGPPRQRAVLGLLALHNGTGIHRDLVIDVLWGGRPPRTATEQIQLYISRLRKALATKEHDSGKSSAIATLGACYELQLEASQLDTANFRSMVDSADEAASRDLDEDACDLYEQALDLWRGDLLADIDLIRNHPVAQEWVSRRSSAVFRFARSAIRFGAPLRALPEVQRLCAWDSLNEAAHAHLMILLAATGHQAAALSVYAKVRRQLVDDLGLSPGPELLKAHAMVLRQELEITVS